MEEAKHQMALWKTLQNIQTQFPSFKIIHSNCGLASVKELVLWGRPLVAQKYGDFKKVLGSDLTYLAGILGCAHKSAHMEKEDKADGGQSCGYASPFGWYSGDFLNLNQKLKAIIKTTLNFPSKRKDAIQIFKENMQTAPGDARRPINEVTLWDWSSIVAALYKAEISRCTITGEQREPKDVQWRLLSIRTNGLEYLLSAFSIPDLKARQELLQNAWDKVRNLLEEEYPLALEVYRDENGPVFVVPDLENLLGLSDSERNAQTLRELILERFRQGTVQDDPCLALQGEIVPKFHLDDDPWDGQSKLPPVGEHLKETPVLQSDPQWVAAQWCNLPKPQERCVVCGLRPQGPSHKALQRGMCDICEKRREDRAQGWATKNLSSTIWLDEVADTNRRVALITGTFDLTHWLDGTLVRSLAVRTPNDQNGHTEDKVAKNPSFARLRRIWETTRKFWEKTLEETEGRLTKRPRIFLRGTVTLTNPKDKESLGPYHAYELEIQGRKVAVLWVPEDAKDEKGQLLPQHGGFWIIENIDYLDNVYEGSFRKIVQSLLGEPLQVYEPSEHGRPGQPVATFTIANKSDVQYLKDHYTPLIPILAEPRTFMALVPADKVFEVVKAIKAKYEREMGKVRNRLPLHLGIVFADSHQPLRIILDTGRRMLEQVADVREWQVVNKHTQPDEGGSLPQRFGDDAQGQFARWYEIELEKNGRQLTWYVPAVMGDGRTEDRWYPYVFLATSDEPTDRNRYYKTDLGNPWNPDHPWLVHACELKPGDIIYFTPATFDFQWLTVGADRFEIAYNNQGQRCGLARRPYLLDHIETLERIWRTLQKHTSESQIHALVSLIETKREEWHAAPGDETFRRFCRDVLINLEWRTEPWRQEPLDAWVDYAAQGWIADAVEIFHGIMKERASTQ
ncbi:MAG: hypothetical protein J7L69_00500 [Desulfobulbaceae bacterium]|nr:hypothetical protein [Desulfobulbaceae bacterium]